MVSRIEELRAELTSAHHGEARQDRPYTRGRRAGDTPREVVKERLDDRERLTHMEERGEIKLGSGRIPDDFWTKPRPADPDGETRAALLDLRE